MARIIECIPNFSEGRDKEKIEKIIDTVRGVEGVKLLDYSSDADHNRTVVTLVGEPAAVENAIINMAEKVYGLIDMSIHHGGHPRMGALDVVPFVPISDVSMDECVEIANRVGKVIGERFSIPVYLYEKAASASHRENLATVRKGQYEGFFEKIKEENWKPDYGPNEVNVKGGCVAISARQPLVAFNVNLGTDNLEIADKIAKTIRHLGGGLRFVKAMGVMLEERNIAQVSMNLVNYEKTAVYRAFEMVKMEAKRYGVPVIGSEVIGLLPMAALINSAEYYLQIENFSMDQILEKRVSE
ncbi:glutamate formiminotransferase [Clostridium argentinense CDC 2741]|uniref:glutamate formimidoyltransferase n=1 Tax=Clostridium argentinense CDC 2741 TaxID=1418104 RepID=A0A0C1U6W2_9CLOT|nr:glutamate formimidoyltransferase [Clostridium argentinense]ARC84513.1 glutamate formiminotransferase [Clostridium argentinense]KIE47513.1 glutamate formiminotransferase [Clostridium argentinense CDC 2741]NFF38704.1 glutamate formimidoyltransferase [Clostridium argentinense]NFP48929.1 glutamate formimidoyltransferase [Clostridium argentinense]NFP72921.1 glutamate formimidoyltransferase [Clostridium argentinense]